MNIPLQTSLSDFWLKNGSIFLELKIGFLYKRFNRRTMRVKFRIAFTCTNLKLLHLNQFHTVYRKGSNTYIQDVHLHGLPSKW